MEKKLSSFVLVLLMALLMLGPALGCPSSGGDCRSCILVRMKKGCPECAPVLRCMARCLWGGASRSVCQRMCDCGQPKLSDCKTCMSRCKCSCMS